MDSKRRRGAGDGGRRPKKSKFGAGGSSGGSAGNGRFPTPQANKRPAAPPRDPRPFTVSIALPGSIVSNAQSAELRTYLVGQVARACAVFNVDEIVVFSETGKRSDIEGKFEGARSMQREGNADVFMARVLEYLETPQYLRKALFPVHKDLRYAGLLNPLDAPHHVRGDEDVKYREGVVVQRPPKAGRGSWVNCGFLRGGVSITHTLPVGTRVTVRIDEPSGSAARRYITGEAVAPDTPRTKDGLYWGYQVRLAAGLNEVMSECPFDGGYDLTLGTSERGQDAQGPEFKLPAFRHMLIVFGGVGGLEDCVQGDEQLQASNPEELFQMYLNVCRHQGSGTIRTEEAIPVAMSVLHPHVLRNQPPPGK